MAKKSGSANKTQSNVLIQHVEKIGLVTTLLLGAMFAWNGFSIEKLDDRKSPEKLKEKSASISTHINDPSWEGEGGLSTKRSAPSDYPERVEKLQRPILAQNYETLMPFDPPMVGQTTRRSDPNLYAAIDLRAVAITASLAYKKSAGVEDFTADDEDPKFEIIKKKYTRKKKDENQTDFGGGEDNEAAMAAITGGGEEGMEGMEDDAGGMPGQGADVVRLSSDQLIGFRPGTNKILESGTVKEIKGAGKAAVAGGNMGGEAGGMEMGVMSEDPGMEEGMDTSMMSGGGNTAGAAASDSVPQPSTVVAVVGVVPYRKQWDEYSRVLQGASGYEASRDQPRYVYLYGERADVSDNPERAIDENEWERVTNFASYRKKTRKWDGSPKELVDKDFLDPFLTFVCPPIMMRDLSEILSHPLIPLRNAPMKFVQAPEEETDDDPENVPDGPGGEVNSSATDNGGGDAMGSGAPDTADDEGDGMGDSMGGGGFGMSGRSIVEFMMVRFFDLSAKPGHVYRYRVRLLLEDPNHPNVHINTNYPQHLAPPARSLDEDVITRIAQMDDAEHKIYWRETEWSKPTAPVLVPDTTQIFAGSVNYLATTAPAENKQIPLQDKVRITYVVKEPMGTILPVVWDPNRGVDIPLRKEVHRGSMLNQSEPDVHYGHPASLLIRRIEEGSYKTGLMVGDIRGGEDLPGTTRDRRVYSPGEFALIDSKGRLIVHNELDDMDGFRRYDFKEQLTKDETTGSNASGTGGNSNAAFGIDGNN